MDLLAHLRIFAAVGQSGHLDAAARELNLAPATLTRSLARLERHLNCTLLTREGSELVLTDAGQEFHSQSARIIGNVDEAVRGVVDRDLQPEGHLRVHADGEFGKRHLIPLIAQYRQHHPGVTFDVLLDNHAPDVARMNSDIVVTLEPLAQEGLISRNIGATYSVLCASADYLAQYGTVVVPEDLVRHQCLNAFEDPINPDDIWSFQGPYGAVNVYLPPAAFQLNTRGAMVEAVCAGLGIGSIPAYIAAPYLQDGRLVRVLPDYHLESRGIHVSCVPAAQADVCVRSWISYLARHLPKSLALTTEPMMTL